MSVFEIPLQPGTGAQTFEIPLNGVTYSMTLTWNNPMQCWILTFKDSSGNYLLDGVPMNTPLDLLAAFEYVGIAGQLFVQSDIVVDKVPGYDSLGTDGHLYFAPNGP